MTRRVKKCKKCGCYVEDQSLYCNFCGYRFGIGNFEPVMNEQERKVWRPNKTIVIIILIIAAAIYFGNRTTNRIDTNGNDGLTKSTATPFVPKSTAVPATTRPSMPIPPNGDLTKYTFAKHEAPFEVVVPSGIDYYYIVLTDSTNTKLKVVSLFVHPGKTVEIEVPLGSYKMFYATGEKWYGKFDLFGQETRRYQADDIFEFYVSGNQIMGHTIELIKQAGGNLETFSIDEDNFPI